MSGSAECYELDGPPQQRLEDASDFQFPSLSWLWPSQPWCCSICDAPLGVLHMRPKYHCRICSRFVCAACSRSAVQLEGQAGSPKRACASCVGVSLQAPELMGRFEVLRARLFELSAEDAALFCRLLDLLPQATRQFNAWCGRGAPKSLLEEEEEQIQHCKSELFHLDGPLDVPEQKLEDDSSWEEVAGVVPSVGVVDGGAMEQDAWSCHVCDSRLGVVRLRPRHHCRMCGKSVCATCSRSSVQVEHGSSTPQRACTACMALSVKAPVLTSRLELLGKRFLARAAGDAPPIGPRSTLQDALLFCELALERLEDVALREGRSLQAPLGGEVQ